MVLTQMVGKKRPFIRGLLLTIVTFGIYGVYWLYKSHDELYKQFELQREGRDEGVVWLILGLVLFPFQFVYMWMFVGNVEYLRQRLDLRKGLSPGGFLGLQIAAYAVFFLGYIPFFLALASLGENATEEQVANAVGGLVVGFALAALVGLTLLIVAYYRLQSDINGVWDAYEQRMRALSASAAPGAAPAAGASFTYWGDLRPPQPALSAPHVRARAEAMARDNPGLALPPELSDLLSRGDAGDAAAVTAAATLLEGTDGLLRERTRLKSELTEAERKQGRLAGRLANGEVDNAAYAAARAELDRERARLEEGLRAVEARLFTPSRPE